MLITKPRQIKTYALLTLSLAFLGIIPAMAQLGDNVSTDFVEGYTEDFRTYLDNNISNTLKSVDGEAQEAISESTNVPGERKTPSPNEAGKLLRDKILEKSKSDTFDNNSAVWGQIVSNELERQITRGAVEGVLGREGQERIRKILVNTENAVKDVQKTFDAAITRSSNDSTQDFVKEQIKIENQQSKMIGETLASTIQVHLDLQYTNLNLANISQQMDEANRARRVDTSAEAARLLRATAQTDLLGRAQQPEN